MRDQPLIESALDRVTREAFERAAMRIKVDVEEMRRRGCIHCGGPLGQRYTYCSERCSVASRAAEAAKRPKGN